MRLTEVAARTGLCWLAIRKIEEGHCRPRVDSVLRICGALEMPFLVVAMLVELRSEGVMVPVTRVFRRWRAVPRIFRKMWISRCPPKGEDNSNYPPTQSQVRQVADQLDALLAAMQRAIP